MRKWHRWLSVFFGIFMLWIAGTGLASQVTALWPAGEPAPQAAGAASAAAPPPGFECPEGWRCMPPRGPSSGMRSWVGFFHHLHSGETFGPVGTAISIMSGLALLFFSVSGLWMYWRMWTNRKARKLRGGLFWK